MWDSTFIRQARSCSVREEGGRVIARTIVPTETSAIIEFFQGMRGTIHVAFEEGTQAQWLHDLIAPVVARVVVCDRRGERRHANKHDLADADELSEQLRRGGLRAVYHGNAHRVRLKELTRAYQNLVEDATRVMLRLKALFRARGIKTPGQGVYHNLEERPQWLAQLSDPGAQLRAELLWAELDVLRQLRPRAKAAMLAEARRDPAWSVLRSIPFLGPVRVAVLLATLQTPWAFPHQAQSVGLCRSGRGHLLQCRLRHRVRPAGAASTSSDDAWAQSQLQPRSQGRIQKCGHRRHRAAWTAADLVSSSRRWRDGRSVGTGDPHP